LKVSIVVPLHNEEENLKALLAELLPVLSTQKWDFELILVNDNSTDSTGRLIEEAALENPKIKTVHRTTTPGFGNAVKTGMMHATGDVIIPVMGDLSDVPEDIPRLVERIEEGYDVAYGSRFVEAGLVSGYPPLKMLANRAYNHLLRLVFGFRHKDITNAFKAYRREVLEEIGWDNIEATGFDLTVELPLKAHLLGFTSVEVPVRWRGRERGEAKLKLSHNASVYGRRLVRLFFQGNLLSLKDLFHFVVRGSKLRLIAAVVLAVLLLYGIFSLIGVSETLSVLRSFSPFYLALQLAVVFTAFMLRTWRWQIILHASGYIVPKSSLFKAIMFGFFLNYLLPARAGDVARGVALKTTEDVPFSIAFSSIVIERAMDMITLALLLGAGIFLTGSGGVLALAGVSIALGLLLVAGLVFVYRFEDFTVRLLEKRFNFIEPFIKRMKEGLYALAHNPSAILAGMLLSAPVWLFEVAGIYLAARAVHYSISYAVSVVSGITAFLALTIPVTPAGLGVHEASITALLSLYQVPEHIGMSIALVDHLARAVITVVFGVVSAVHIGFASRSFFREQKLKGLEGVDEA
jgi:hypothetical protein